MSKVFFDGSRGGVKNINFEQVTHGTDFPRAAVQSSDLGVHPLFNTKRIHVDAVSVVKAHCETWQKGKWVCTVFNFQEMTKLRKLHCSVYLTEKDNLVG